MKLRFVPSFAGVLCCAGVVSGMLAAAEPDAMKLLDTAPLRFEPDNTSTHFTARGARYHFEFSNSQTILSASEHQIALRFDGADPSARIEAEEKLSSKTNLYLGNDPSQWRKGVPNYGRLRVPGLYPGIDLVYYGNARELEYDLKIAPGADPGRIHLRITGAQAKVNRDGDLVAELIQKRPIAYQTDSSGARIAIKARYRRNRDGSYGFALGSFDRSRELIIDPVLTFSTYFSGSGTDMAYAIAHDQNGHIYVAGSTTSTDFPLAGAPSQASAGGNGDVWVAEINPNVPAGQGFLFTTYIGGSGVENFGGLAVGPHGDIYVSGSTESTNFPLTSGAYQGSLTNAPNTNAFVVWINSSQSLAYASYLGGKSADFATGIAVDPHGRIWVTGGAQSNSFPVAGAYQGSFGGSQDIFIAGFDPSQSGSNSLIYSSYLGGTGWDTGRGIAVASDGTLWIAAGTYSYDIPVQNAYQPHYRGGGDAYVAHIDPTMGSSGLLYATFLGGGNLEEARNIVLDPSGPVIVSGYTVSSDFPVTSNAYQQAYGGNTDAFVAVLNASANQLVYSTYFGGAEADVPFDLKRDSAGTLYLSGLTTSSGLPATPGALQSAYDGTLDVFVLRLDPSQAGAAGIDYFTYLGSDGLQIGYGVDFDSSGNVYVVGSATGPIFDALGGAGKSSGSGKTDAFVAGFPICSFTLSLNSQQFPEAGGTGTIEVTAGGGNCPWTASSGLDWVTISPASASGSGSVTITVAANTTGAARQGSITIAGQQFLVGQDASTAAGSHFRR
jgi:hypothetical protein